MDSGNHWQTRIAVLTLSVALVCGASLVYYEFGLFLPRARQVTASNGLGNGYGFGNDFYPVWLAARKSLARRSDPYGSAMTRDIQTGLFGRPLDAHIPSDPTDLRMFAHPAFTLLLFWPIAELPFEIARVVVVILLGIITIASIIFWMRALLWRPGLIWLAAAILCTVCSYPVLEGLYAGQIGLAVAFLLAWCLLALRQGRLGLAGMLLALTTTKPQMTLLAIVYLLIWSLQSARRRRLCLSFFVTMLALVSAALTVWPRWIQQWIHALDAYRGYARPPLVGAVLANQFAPQRQALATDVIFASLMVVSLLLIWRNRHAATNSPRFWFTLTLLLAISTVTLLPGQAVYDHVLLLSGVLLLASRWRTLLKDPVAQTLTVIGIGVLLWPGIASLGLIVVRPFLAEQLFYSRAVFSLPLRSAAAFPFIVLALLAVVFRKITATEFSLAG